MKTMFSPKWPPPFSGHILQGNLRRTKWQVARSLFSSFVTHLSERPCAPNLTGRATGPRTSEEARDETPGRARSDAIDASPSWRSFVDDTVQNSLSIRCDGDAFREFCGRLECRNENGARLVRSQLVRCGGTLFWYHPSEQPPAHLDVVPPAAPPVWARSLSTRVAFLLALWSPNSETVVSRHPAPFC